jgi:hypothetical protein
LSNADAGPTATTADARPGLLPLETSAGAVITGFSLSSTVTFCDAVEVRPAVFVAVHVIVVVPFG